MGSAKLTNAGFAATVVADALFAKGLIGTGVLRNFTDEEADEVFALMARVVRLGNDEQLVRGLDGPEHDEAGFVSVSDALKMPTCFSTMCKHMGVEVPAHSTSVSELGNSEQAHLRLYSGCRVGYTVYSTDDPRNHVVPVSSTKSSTVDFTVDGGTGADDCVHGVTSPQEFFNAGGRFYRTKFYADQETSVEPAADDQSIPRPVSSRGAGAGAARQPQSAGTQGAHLSGTPQGDEAGFGDDATDFFIRDIRNRPPPPESIDGSGVPSGGANVTGGVVRPKKRVIKATTGFDRSSAALRSYAVAGTTLFNNMDELFLNTVSRSYAQEVLEFLFQTWGVPTEEPETMRYAEDLVFAFLIARTASNKADYTVAYDVPTKRGPVEADFSRFSVLLADHYGITRRNFCRGIADDLRDYLRRPENQPIRSRAAARVGADPQYGHLCFDGSTECSNLTTSEQKFTRILEAKGLYESDAVLADGASANLMEGIHGGTRSNVAR